MTSLQSYLAAGAVEDVRKLMTSRELGRGDDVRKRRLVGSDLGFYLERKPGEVWIRVFLCHFGGPDRTEDQRWTVRYREPSPGQYVVSDCGETVCEVMRRTGCGDHGARVQARAAIFGSPEGYALGIVNKGEQPWLMLADYVIQADRVTASDLPAAIVSVLSAVAKVRAAIDKDGGR